jgi:hypothetical protein
MRAAILSSASRGLLCAWCVRPPAPFSSSCCMIYTLLGIQISKCALDSSVVACAILEQSWQRGHGSLNSTSVYVNRPPRSQWPANPPAVFPSRSNLSSFPSSLTSAVLFPTLSLRARHPLPSLAHTCRDLHHRRHAAASRPFLTTGRPISSPIATQLAFIRHFSSLSRPWSHICDCSLAHSHAT